MNTYPYFRTRISDDGNRTSVFKVQSENEIIKIKANATAYIYVGPHQEAESDLMARTQEYSQDQYSEVVEDVKQFALGNRVGASPIIHAPHKQQK